MIFEKIDFLVRMACVVLVCLFGSLGFIFWLVGLEHNMVWNQKSCTCWALGLSILLISLGIGLLALYPTKIETLFPYFCTKIIIRIPVYSVALVGLFLFFRQLVRLK